MIVTPVETLRPGELAMLHVTLLDDRWEGIPRATLRMNDDVVVVTNGVGVALVEIMPPETEEALTLPFTFAYDGDDLRMPMTYFIGIPVTPHGFNWLLWVGAPGVVAALAAAGYAGRRLNVVPAPSLGRRRAAPEVAPSQADSDDDALELAMEALVETRAAVTLGIDFAKPAADLPDVWGVGEVVDITVRAVDAEGRGIAGMELAVTVTGEDAAMLVTDDDGASALRITADYVGEHTISVAFAGDEDNLPASSSRSYRVVDYREEIVRLYNDFLAWARASIGSDLEQATPREVELMLVTSGTPVPQKSLDELISRFEEADYSEHPIARRHYESMYRAWRAVVEA